MAQMIDAHETAFRHFWAGASDGQGVENQNYFNPQKAVEIQYGWTKPKFDTGPQTTASIGSQINRNPFKNTEPFGMDVLKFSMLDEQLSLGEPKKRPEYREYTAPPTPDMYNIKPVGQPTQFYGAFDWLKNIFGSLKNFFLGILAKLGLYTPKPPTAPQNLGGMMQSQIQGIQEQVLNQQYSAPPSTMFSGPFDKHTVIFTREVIP